MKTVPLGGKKAAGRVALVDDGDYELVMQYRWHVTERRRPNGSIKGPYAAAAKHPSDPPGPRIIRMHNLIIGSKGVDHENHNGLDNRRSNLRVADNSQNHANMPIRSGGSSRYKGVTWDRSRNKWLAKIKVNYKLRNLGRFASEEDAARAYDAAAREAFGEFACPNFPR